MFDRHRDIQISLFRLNLIECELPNEKTIVNSEKIFILIPIYFHSSMKPYPRRNAKQKFQNNFKEMIECRFFLTSLLDSILFEVEHGVRISKGKQTLFPLLILI